LSIQEHNAEAQAPTPYFINESGSFSLFEGDCLALIPRLGEARFDLIFADPPYFLSNGGVTCKGGKMVSVHKGDWDRSRGPEANHAFNLRWLEACQRALTPNGTLFVSGTHHTIYSLGFALQQLGFKILNDLTWNKPNPPPNLACRTFTHTTETILWAAKSEKSRYRFNYPDMKVENGGKQMKSLWTFTPPGNGEKRNGKHPTQKPLALLERILRAASQPGDQVLDPFNGSGTTGIAALKLGRRYVGLDIDPGPSPGPGVHLGHPLHDVEGGVALRGGFASPSGLLVSVVVRA
jgi:site-specific DNA-methyltransferase (adenine-specific)